MEICIDHAFATISFCHGSWDSREAEVVCRALGYPAIGNEIWLVLVDRFEPAMIAQI